MRSHSALGLSQKAKSAPKTSEDIAEGGFIELHYILKGLVAPAHKESQSVQINRAKAPLLYFFHGEIGDWYPWQRQSLQVRCWGTRVPSSGRRDCEPTQGFPGEERKSTKNIQLFEAELQNSWKYHFFLRISFQSQMHKMKEKCTLKSKGYIRGGKGCRDVFWLRSSNFTVKFSFPNLLFIFSCKCLQVVLY